MIGEKQIEELLGTLLDQIGDSKLRRKVIEAWDLGCRQGGWESVEDLKSMPFTLLTDTRGISFIEHTLAVTEGALGLAHAMERHYTSLPHHIDLDRLIAGGLLHDVGKLLEVEKDGKGGYRRSHSGRCVRHPISGSMLAAQVGLPDEIINIIACHSKEGDGRPKTPETVLIHQADFATFDPLILMQKGLLVQ